MASYIGTTTPLQQSGAANSADTFTSGTRLRDRYDTIAGSVFADKDGTIYVEQSPDGTNWDISTSYSVTASDGKGFSETLLQPYWRIRFVNTAGSAQTAFRLSANMQGAGDS